MRIKYWIHKWKVNVTVELKKMMKCICSGEQSRIDEIIPSSESLATRDYSASGYSSRAGETETKVDTNNIEEAESSLRESGFLNYEEARALLGRLEYQKGNIEAALHVFEGIDIAAVASKIKITIARRCELPKRNCQSDASPPMSMHAVILLFEAIFLKAKSLQVLGRYTEAAQSCKVILDTVQAAVPDGLPEIFSSDWKLIEIVHRAVELLPELWKLAYAPQEAILAYRWALLYHWNLDLETRTNVEKSFAIFLLYTGTDANPPTLGSQAEDSFVPKNNIEEAVLLLLLILRKFILKRIGWDPSILDHLCFALSIAGEFSSLADEVQRLPPVIVETKEKYAFLALCYHAEGEDVTALNLLRNLLNNRENRDCTFELLLASKLCAETPNCVEEGMRYIYRLVSLLQGKCDHIASTRYFLLGVTLSAESRGMVSDSQRISKRAQAITALETAQRMEKERNAIVLFHLTLENAEQRKLDAAFYHAKKLLKLEAGCSVKGWILLARILSAQKRHKDAENIIEAALDETGNWDQGELLRTKAKLQMAQGFLRDAIETYTKLLAVLQVQTKCLGDQKKLLKIRTMNKSLEMETWHDLANVYTSLSQWRDAEICLSKSEILNSHSASRLHSTGLLYQAQGLLKEALKSFERALDIDPNHVPSLISTADVLRQFSDQSIPVAKSFLTDALRLERTNHSAWYSLGLLHKSEICPSPMEAIECFEAAALLEESSPVEPFR